MSSSLIKKAARAELERRKSGSGKVVQVLNKILSPKQRAFIDDPARFKLARCPRRSGKSHADAVYLIRECIASNNTPTLYLGLTRESAKGAVWDAIITILQELKIPHTATVSGPRVDFPNGSFIQLIGADAQNAVNRIRGRKFKLAIVDEMGFYSAADYLIEALMPTLADYAGTLAMTSSPGYIPAGLFYDADVGTKKSSWSQHSWTLLDNPLFQKPANNQNYTSRGEEELHTICNMQFGGDWSHPVFRREYLGEWVYDASSMIYPYTANNIRAWNESIPMRFALGISVEPNHQGLTIVRYSDQSRHCHFEYSARFHFQNLNDFAAQVQEVVKKYKPILAVCDSSTYSELLARELNARYDLHMQPLKIKDEAAYQKLIATDLIGGNVTVTPENVALLSEWAKLMKDESGNEIGRLITPVAAAALAVYSKVYNTVLKSPEIVLTEEERIEAAVEEQAKYENATPWYERED